MHPLGQYIKIEKQATIKEDFIVEANTFAEAKVVAVSPDIKVPFRSNDTVVFYRGSQIYHRGEVYLPLFTLVLYKLTAQ